VPVHALALKAWQSLQPIIATACRKQMKQLRFIHNLPWPAVMLHVAQVTHSMARARHDIHLRGIITMKSTKLLLAGAAAAIAVPAQARDGHPRSGGRRQTQL
jgi:hypothetical protein